MITIELIIDEDFDREQLEKFMKLTKGAEVFPTLNDNLEITGIWARLDG